MAKTKRFMDGGQVPPNQYPFANNPNSVQVGSQQEPLDEVMGAKEPVTMYKRGGKVKKYAEGGKADYAIPDARARAAMQEEADKQKREKMGEAYERSLTSTAPAPKAAASAPAKPLKKAGGGCAKGYAEGGVAEGENKNIDDDTRMRARAALMRRLAGEEDETPSVKRSAPKADSKPGPSGRPRDNAAQGGTKARFNVSQGGTKADNLKQKRMKDFLSYQEMQRNMPEETSSAAKDAMRRNLESAGRDYEAASYDGMKSGGKVKCYSGGGSVRGAGIAQRGVRKCKVV